MNQGKNPLIVRAMYIIIVPVVLLIIILNTGILQRTLPAARVHGRTYTVARYNFYYFDCYNSFLSDNELRLSELGYDPAVSADQQMHESGVTWKEFFRRQGEAAMAETAYYCDLAEAEGYEFSEDELAPVRERQAADAAFQAQIGVNAANYYVAYYGRGMNANVYNEELTRCVKARAYKEHLERTYPVPQAQIDAYIAQHPAAEYDVPDLRVITLAALADRGTGEIGAEQTQALREKLARLEARYDAGVPFEELQAAFSTRAAGDDEGLLYGATAAELPEAVAAWYLAAQDTVKAGDTAALTDESGSTAYFIVVDGFGQSGAVREASLVLGREAVAAAETEALASSDYAVLRVSPGIRLTTA